MLVMVMPQPTTMSFRKNSAMIFASCWLQTAGQVAEVEARVKARIQGKVGIAQCDGWKNNAKKSVVSTMIMVENEVCILFCYIVSLILIIVLIGIPYEHTRHDR